MLTLDKSAAFSSERAFAEALSILVPGGVIVFDDYGWQMLHKQKETDDNFLRRGRNILELPTATAWS